MLHAVSAISGILGALAVLGAWIAGQDGTVFGFSQSHLYSDATVLLLGCIAAGVGVLFHRELKRNHE